MANSTIVFVIMPFSKTTGKHIETYWTDHFIKFLKPLIEEVPGTTAERSKVLRGDLLRQIITELVSRPVVVADLTDANPNVYWELGVRQSFKHGTVTIAEKGTPIPFDVSTKGVLFYDPSDHIQLEGFRENFKAAIFDCTANPDITDSQILDAISGRGSLYEIIHREELLRRLAAVTSECTDNTGTVKWLRRTIAANEKREKNDEDPNLAIPTVLFRIAAVELLVTWRYLDRPQAFYDAAEDCMDTLMGVNSQLAVWEASPGPTQDWVKVRLDVVDKVIRGVAQRIRKASKELVTSL